MSLYGHGEKTKKENEDVLSQPSFLYCTTVSVQDNLGVHPAIAGVESRNHGRLIRKSNPKSTIRNFGVSLKGNGSLENYQQFPLYVLTKIHCSKIRHCKHQHDNVPYADIASYPYVLKVVALLYVPE